MPPKGRGRGRGVPRQDQGPQQPGQPAGQRQQAGRPPGQQQQPGRPPGQQQQAPGQAAPPGFRQQAPVPSVGTSAPGAPLQKAESTGAKPKSRPVDPEMLGIQLRHTQLVESELPPKPPAGKLGRKIRLISNCLSIETPGGNVYHYDVEIISKGLSMTTKKLKDDEGDKQKGEKDDDKKKYRCLSTKRNREIINLLVSTDASFKGMFPAYDGRKNLYTRRPLKIGKMLKCNVVIPDENPGDPNDPRGRRTDDFQVVIRPVEKSDTHDCSINLDSLHAVFSGHVRSVNQEAIMAIETILRQGPCNRFTPVGRSFYPPPLPQDIHPLGGGLEIWFGYHQSLRLGQWKPVVNIDLTATAFYSHGPVLDFIANFLNFRDPRQLHQSGPIKDSDIHRLSKELRTMQIAVTHLRYRRKYRVIRLTRESADRLHFNLTENGNTVRKTVAQYFKQNYNLTLQFPHLPCIQVNPEKKGIFIPVEVCDLIEGQHSRKKLDEKQTAEMIKFTAKPPKLRFNEIRKSIKTASFNGDPCLREFGIKVSNEPLSLEGRVIDAPSVRYNNESKIRPRDGSWDMRGQQYFRGAEIKSWILLSFANPRFCGQQQLEKFAHLLCNIASEQGISINRPETIEMIDHRRQSVQNVLTKMKKTFNADLAVVVVPAMNKSVYGDVKQAAETILGLSTQCIKEESVTRKCNPPLVSNLCQKINAKMGGVNNSLTPGETPPILRRPVIIIGADVTHPSPGADHEIKASIAACVGSLDAHPSRYAVTIRAQTNKNIDKESIEIILELKEMVLELLKAFYRNTRGKKPEKIIFYRDGVSEGQFGIVKRHELQCVREACRTLDPDYEPGITFIIVQKRHHVRFMPQDERSGAGKMRNIPPGTTVDNTVTHPLNFDFFLCSHFGLQGTSRPCHYTVLEDDNDFTADDLQTLTYYLCHTYVRCTKSISCPSPVQYAHLAAFRARQHMATQIDESSASSTTSSLTSHILPEAVINAIKVVEGLKNTMYFV